MYTLCKQMIALPNTYKLSIDYISSGFTYISTTYGGV